MRSSIERTSALLQKFNDLKEDFDRSIRVRLFASVLTSGEGNTLVLLYGNLLLPSRTARAYR